MQLLSLAYSTLNSSIRKLNNYLEILRTLKSLKIRVMVQNLFQPKVRQHLHYTWAELTIYANTISGLNHP